MKTTENTSQPARRDRIAGAMLGLLVGDALGVPVEFQTRARLDANPVTGMRANSSHHQPAGTWSDDGSLALVTMISLLEGYDPHRMMTGYARWRFENWMTPHGSVFDIGNTTAAALQRYQSGRPRKEWGSPGDHENGNGSLMRIMPLSLFLAGCSKSEIVAKSFEVSALTHAHIRSCLCCAYFSLLVRELVLGVTLNDAMATAAQALVPHVPPEERAVFERVLNGSIVHEPRQRVRGSGYVLHCLEAALWCTARHDNYADTVLAAVNLGEDTDTTAAVAGGLSGLIYGRSAIPCEWCDVIARRDEILPLIEQFAAQISLAAPA